MNTTREKLRLGILVDGMRQPRWRYELIREICESDYARPALVIENGAASRRPGRLARLWDDRHHLLYRAYSFADRRLFPQDPDAFEDRDLSGLLGDCPRIRVVPRQTRFSDRLTIEDVERIRAAGLDVVLRLGFRILRGGVLGVARHGVWSYHHGDNRAYRGSPPAFWEVMEGNPLTGSVLQRLTEELDGGEVLYRSHGATDRRSVARSRNRLYWKSAAFVPRKLAELHRTRALTVEPPALAPYEKPLYRRPSNRRMARLLVGLGRRYLRDTLRGGHDQWCVFFHLGPGPGSAHAPLYRFKKLVPPPDRFWADPFPVVHQDRHYVFVEEFLFRTSKAHISVLEIDDRGNVSRPTLVLERDHHLSYPFVFEWDGRQFMLPEASGSRRVELYECEEFPTRWKPCAVLLDDVRAVDATLWEDSGWWMFVNIARPGASSHEELHLFRADTPLGPWLPHRANPVKSDVRSSRPAGRLFRSGGELIRPAQDCSRRYGYALSLNRVTRLDDERFEETEVARIGPDWLPGLEGVHSYNRAGRLTVVDGVMPRRRMRRLARAGVSTS